MADPTRSVAIALNESIITLILISTGISPAIYLKVHGVKVLADMNAIRAPCVLQTTLQNPIVNEYGTFSFSISLITL